MIKTEHDGSSRQAKNSRSAAGERASDVEQMTYEFMSDESASASAAAVKPAQPIPAPKTKQNLAYGKVKIPEAARQN